MNEKPFFTEDEFITALAENGGEADAYLLVRIRRLLIKRNQTWQAAAGLRQPYVYAKQAVKPWAAYLRRRQQKIECGEWRSTRAFSLEDYDDAQRATTVDGSKQ